MSNTALSDQNIDLTPPAGDPATAEKYISQLIQLIERDKITIHHTDLNKFNPGLLNDHYRIDLNDYQIEVSHSKHPNSGKDSYIILFNNLKNITVSSCEKVILAYMHLEHDQFTRFKKASLEQIDRIKRIEDQKRLENALKPVDQILNNLENNSDKHSRETNLSQSPLHSIMAVS